MSRPTTHTEQGQIQLITFTPSGRTRSDDLTVAEALELAEELIRAARRVIA